MQRGTFKGDPYSGYGTFVDAEGNEYNGYLEDFTEGRFGVGLGGFYELDKGGLPLSIGRQGPFSFTIYSGDKFQLVSETRRGTLNRGFGTHTELTATGESVTKPNEFIRMVEGTITVVDPNGIPREFSVSQVPIAGVGTQWVRFLKDNGEYGYFSARGPFASDAEVQAVFGEGYYLATGEESSFAAILKRLMTDNPEALAEWADEHSIEGTKERTKEYYAAMMIMELGSFANIRSFTSTVFE